MKPQVTIVGGGLSGLHTASILVSIGVEVKVIEARERLGGRILSEYRQGAAKGEAQQGFDLGPTWFWPGQKRMESLVKELGLVEHMFWQHAEGDALYEDHKGTIHRGIQGISMAGSYRIQGGLSRIIEALSQRIPATSLHTNAKVTRVALEGDQVRLEVTSPAGQEQFTSDFLVVALPPRLAMASLAWSPAFPKARAVELASIPTWMAGHAKFVALYDIPFWRKNRLSGDAVSQRGPLHEIHDASPQQGGPYALFGFSGEMPTLRRQGEAPVQAVIAQFVRLFGPDAASPLEVYAKDWARDVYTATSDDQDITGAHALAHLTQHEEASWNHRLLWSGSETASSANRNNGYLEGALEASERTIATLQKRF